MLDCLQAGFQVVHDRTGKLLKDKKYGDRMDVKKNPRVRDVISCMCVV